VCADAAAASPPALSLHPAAAATSAAAAAAAAAVRAAPPRAFGANCTRGSLPCCGLRCCIRARAVAKGSAPSRSALPASLLPPGKPAALLLSACKRLPLWRASSSPPESVSQRSKGSAAASPPLLAAAAAPWRRSAQLNARPRKLPLLLGGQHPTHQSQRSTAGRRHAPPSGCPCAAAAVGTRHQAAESVCSQAATQHVRKAQRRRLQPGVYRLPNASRGMDSAQTAASGKLCLVMGRAAIRL
jgi:hypothetical protein